MSSRMRREYPLETDKVDTYKSRPRSKGTQESVTGSTLPEVSIPRQVGNLAMQHANEESFLKSRSQDNEDMAETLGHGGGQSPGKAPPAEPQKGGSRTRSTNLGGRGPGRMRNAGETTYDVNGSTLASITGQLHQAGGYASETNTPIGLAGRVSPQRKTDGTYQVEVQWQINRATTLLPRWADYDNACVAAQTEWDRFMQQIRRHEQTAHVDAALNFVRNLGPEDTVITGASVDDVKRNLEAKQQELADRLQAIHDACTHGYDIDAILHPDNGGSGIDRANHLPKNHRQAGRFLKNKVGLKIFKTLR